MDPSIDTLYCVESICKSLQEIMASAGFDGLRFVIAHTAAVDVCI